MLWSRDYELNEGIHGEANGVPFDVIIRASHGTERYRYASLEVRYGDSTHRVRVHSDHPPRHIFQGLDMQLIFDRHTPPRKVCLACNSTFLYEVRKYPVQAERRA